MGTYKCELTLGNDYFELTDPYFGRENNGVTEHSADALDIEITPASELSLREHTEEILFFAAHTAITRGLPVSIAQSFDNERFVIHGDQLQPPSTDDVVVNHRVQRTVEALIALKTLNRSTGSLLSDRGIAADETDPLFVREYHWPPQERLA